MLVVVMFRVIDRLFHSAVKRIGLDSQLGAWAAYWSGRVIFQQLRYVERIEKLSGWRPVEVVTPPLIPYTLSVDGAVRHGYIGDGQR